MSNIYERIGRAISSGGLYDIIRAETQEEVEILEGCDFKKVGSMLEGEKVVSLYKIEVKTVEKIVQVPIISPTIKPYPPIDTSPWEYPGRKPQLPGIGSPWVSNEPYTAKLNTGDSPDWMNRGNTISDGVDYSVSAGLYELGSMFQPNKSSDTATITNDSKLNNI